MRRSPLLLALVLAACSHQSGTAGLGSPTPAPALSAGPTSAAPPTLSPHRRATTGPVATHTPAVRRTSVVLPGARLSVTGTRSPSPRPAKTWVMTISGFAFDPDTPAIHVGDSIRVTNADPDPHTLTARNGSFDSGQLGQHQSVTLRFTKVGVFDFVCTNHSTMTGQLTVS